MYINIDNPRSTTPCPLLPTDWPSSVMPVYQVTAQIKLPGTSLAIKGYPIVPAFGTTVHGIQGETREAIAITNLRPPNIRHVDPHAQYVALSRIKTRNGLHWIGKRPSAQDYDYFRPSVEVIVEDNRLKHLSNATLLQFEQLRRFTGDTQENPV